MSGFYEWTTRQKGNPYIYTVYSRFDAVRASRLVGGWAWWFWLPRVKFERATWWEDQRRCFSVTLTWLCYQYEIVLWRWWPRLSTLMRDREMLGRPLSVAEGFRVGRAASRVAPPKAMSATEEWLRQGDDKTWNEAIETAAAFVEKHGLFSDERMMAKALGAALRMMKRGTKP